MKNKVIFTVLVLMSSTTFYSCGSKDANEEKKQESGWSEAEKKTYMNACVDGSKGSLGEDKAKEYCDCTLKNLEKEYPKASELANVSPDEIMELAKKCME